MWELAARRSGGFGDELESLRGCVSQGLGLLGRELEHWVETARKGEVEKRSGAIELRSESGEAVMTWHLQGVWPSEITGPSFNVSGSELAIESLEFSVEGLSIG